MPPQRFSGKLIMCDAVLRKRSLVLVIKRCPGHVSRTPALLALVDLQTFGCDCRSGEIMHLPPDMSGHVHESALLVVSHRFGEICGPFVPFPATDHDRSTLSNGESQVGPICCERSEREAVLLQVPWTLHLAVAPDQIGDYSARSADANASRSVRQTDTSPRPAQLPGPLMGCMYGVGGAGQVQRRDMRAQDAVDALRNAGSPYSDMHARFGNVYQLR